MLSPSFPVTRAKSTRQRVPLAWRARWRWGWWRARRGRRASRWSTTRRRKATPSRRRSPTRGPCSARSPRRTSTGRAAWRRAAGTRPPCWAPPSAPGPPCSSALSTPPHTPTQWRQREFKVGAGGRALWADCPPAWLKRIAMLDAILTCARKPTWVIA